MPDREWVQSDQRAENLGIRKEKDELRLDSWMKKGQQDETKQSVVVYCSWFGDPWHCLEEP